MHIDVSTLQKIMDEVINQNKDKIKDLGYAITQSIDGFTNSNSAAGHFIFNHIIEDMPLALALYAGQTRYLSDKSGVKHE